MPKTKSAAQAAVSDGSGGMVALEDHRFDDGPWAVTLEIPAVHADAWMQYLHAECDDRGWSAGTFGQIGADENSQSMTIRTAAPGQSPEVTVIWERARGGPLRVRARINGDPQPSQDLVVGFIDRVNERLHAGGKQPFYRRGFLQYISLPWKGELWLDDNVRLGPPAQHAEWLIAPQIIVVDTVVHAVGWRGANAEFGARLEELARFLSVVMRTNVRLPEVGHAWVIDQEKNRSEIRQIGYWEASERIDMPKPGEYPAVPLRPVNRLDFGLHGITADDHEEWLPDDIYELWRCYVNLSEERRDQFQQAARALQSARLLGRENKTLSLALRVVACEALKPRGKKYDRMNVYDVVEGILGEPYVRALRGLRFPPQTVRSRHLHRGEVLDPEGIHRIMTSTFQDPTFDHEYGLISQIADAVMIEWLRRGGTFPVRGTMRPGRRRLVRKRKKQGR